MPSRWIEIIAKGVVRIVGQFSLAEATVRNFHGFRNGYYN